MVNGIVRLLKCNKKWYVSGKKKNNKCCIIGIVNRQII